MLKMGSAIGIGISPVFDLDLASGGPAPERDLFLQEGSLDALLQEDGNYFLQE